MFQLARCCAVFVPADPSRAGEVAFWRSDGEAPPAVASGSVADLTVLLPGGNGVEPVRVPAVLLPVRAALPLLTRARVATDGHRSAVFWGTAGVLALHFLARGLLLPGLSPADHDTWRLGPLTARDAELVRELAAAMPPEAHAVPVPTAAGVPLLPDPERLLGAFLDAVADTLPRSPAAPLVTGGPAYTAPEPSHLPGQRAWADDIAAGHDAGVRLSLRVEVPGLDESTPDDAHAPGGAPLRFRAVLQVHTVNGPANVADAVEVWAGSGASNGAFGPRARMDVLLALR
ncbi:ATP-dependent helicase, partial [Streptomyces sp. NPDC058964]